MSLNIPQPRWATEEFRAERGENGVFEMFTKEGNDAVAQLLQNLVQRAEEQRWMRDEIVTWLKNGLAILAMTHGEVHDTEPEWAIVDVLNPWLEERGFRGITRNDL